MIREMAEEDIPLMIELGASMHLESEYAPFEYSRVKCQALGNEIISNDAFCGFVSESNGVINGMFIGASWGHYFSDAVLSSDLLLYVDKESRGGLTGLRLIKRYIQWAKDRKVDDIRLGETAGIDREAVNRLYTKLGFTNCGTIYKLIT